MLIRLWIFTKIFTTFQLGEADSPEACSNKSKRTSKDIRPSRLNDRKNDRSRFDLRASLSKFNDGVIV